MFVTSCTFAKNEEVKLKPIGEELSQMYYEGEAIRILMAGYKQSIQHASDEEVIEYITSNGINSFKEMPGGLDALSFAFFYGRSSVVELFLEQDWNKAPENRKHIWTQQLCDNFTENMFSIFSFHEGFIEIISEPTLSWRCLENQIRRGNANAFRTLYDFIGPKHSISSSMLQIVNEESMKLESISTYLKAKQAHAQ